MTFRMQMRNYSLIQLTAYSFWTDVSSAFCVRQVYAWWDRRILALESSEINCLSSALS